MATLNALLRTARPGDLLRVGGRLLGLVMFGGLIYSYCHLLGQAAARGLP